MNERSENRHDWSALRRKVIGLGNESIRKSYYPELQQRLRELQDSQAWLQTVFDSVNDAIFIANPETGTIVDANRRACEMFGYSREQFVNLDVGELTSREPPYTAEAAHQQVARAAEVELPAFEWQVRHGTGKLFWIEISMRLAMLGGERRLVVVARDVTERKRAEDDLREAELRFRSLIEQSPFPTAIISPEGHYTYVNPAFQRAWEMSDETFEAVMSSYNILEDEELVAKGVMPLVEQAFAGEAAAMPPMHYETAPVQRLFDNRLEIRSSWWVRANLYPLKDTEGNVRAVVLVQEDVSAAKEAEKREREFYRRTISAATQGKLQIVEREELLRVAGPQIASFELGSTGDLSVIRNAFAEMAAGAGIDESRAYDFTVAVGEAIANAIKHAGGGRVTVHRPPGALMFMVADDGPGIETLTIPQVALVRGYTTAGTLGMGYKVIISVADKVYLATGPGGTAVGLQMSIHPDEDAAAAAASSSGLS